MRSGEFTLTSTPVPSFNHQVQQLVYSVQPCLIKQGRTVLIPQGEEDVGHHAILDSVAVKKSSVTGGSSSLSTCNGGSNSGSAKTSSNSKSASQDHSSTDSSSNTQKAPVAS